jgi:hypothetical protein
LPKFFFFHDCQKKDTARNLGLKLEIMKIHPRFRSGRELVLNSPSFEQGKWYYGPTRSARVLVDGRGGGGSEQQLITCASICFEKLASHSAVYSWFWIPHSKQREILFVVQTSND